MASFRRADVDGATATFDRAWEADPSVRPFLWQRGLSLYYSGRFQDGAEQFRSDVAVNPRDTEESVWCFICEARTLGPEAARAQFLQVGQDPRLVMRAVYECFKEGAADPGSRILGVVERDGSGPDFYARLYTALYYEAHGTLDEPRAREWMVSATSTPYAKLAGDYMADLARVHVQRRGWVPLA